MQWRTQYWHAVLDERGFGKDLIDRLSDSAMDLDVKTGELSMSEVDPGSRNLMNLDPVFTLHEAEFRMERAWKTSTRDYFNGSLEWIYLTNPPTAYKIEHFLQWFTINDRLVSTIGEKFFVNTEKIENLDFCNKVDNFSLNNK